MQIVTNPGSNLHRAIVDHYGIVLSPQQIVVDDELHDTRTVIPLPLVDEWLATAKRHPYVLGTAAAEFAALFRELAQSDTEILAIMTSRKLIGSHQAALSSAKTVLEHPRYAHLRIEVVDTGVTDLGAGLCTILAAEARAAGLGIAKVARLVEEFSARMKLVLSLETLDPLVKSGRASFLRAWMAGVLRIRPLIGLVHGELKIIAKVSAKLDPQEQMVARALEDVPAGSRIWLAIAHGQCPERAQVLLHLFRQRYEVEYALVRPLSSSIYVNVGPGALACFFVPTGELPWRPLHPPPDFRE